MRSKGGSVGEGSKGGSVGEGSKGGSCLGETRVADVPRTSVGRGDYCFPVRNYRGPGG